MWMHRYPTSASPALLQARCHAQYPRDRPSRLEKGYDSNRFTPVTSPPPFFHSLIDHTLRILQKHPDRPVHPPPCHTPVGSTNPTPPSPLLHHQQHHSNSRPARSTPRPRSTRDRTGRPSSRRLACRSGRCPRAPSPARGAGRGGAERKVKMVLAWLWERC